MNLPCRYVTSASARRSTICVTLILRSSRMPSSRRSKAGPGHAREGGEPRDFTQLGLDFAPACEYIIVPRKETDRMNQELFETLEKKVGDLLEKYVALKEENARL